MTLCLPPLILTWLEQDVLDAAANLQPYEIRRLQGRRVINILTRTSAARMVNAGYFRLDDDGWLWITPLGQQLARKHAPLPPYTGQRRTHRPKRGWYEDQLATFEWRAV